MNSTLQQLFDNAAQSAQNDKFNAFKTGGAWMINQFEDGRWPIYVNPDGTFTAFCFNWEPVEFEIHHFTVQGLLAYPGEIIRQPMDYREWKFIQEFHEDGMKCYRKLIAQKAKEKYLALRAAAPWN